MPAAPSSAIDPAISQLLAAAQCLEQEPARLLPVLSVLPDPRARREVRRRLAAILDAAPGSWAQQRTAPAPGRRRIIAVDGMTLRGSGTADGPGRHLLAALDHAHGVVLGQVDVEAKTNEIPMFATVLDRIDLTGAVITADALHAQRAARAVTRSWRPRVR